MKAFIWYWNEYGIVMNDCPKMFLHDGSNDFVVYEISLLLMV